MPRPHIGKWLLVAVIGLISVIWVAPMVLVILAGMKTPQELAETGYFGFSGSLGQLWENMWSAAELSGLWSGFGNSLLYGIVGALIAVLVSAMASYALVFLRVRAPFLLFMLIYTGTVLPLQMFMIPLNVGYKSVGLYDTHAGMIVFYVAICIPFCVFVFRGYFLGLPGEVLEAAQIDGASRLRIFSRIIVPMSVNPAILLFLTQFLWIWNDLLFGQVLTSSGDARPIMPALAVLSGTVQLGSLPERMAGALLASVPAILLFLFLRKRLMQGFALHVN